MEQRADGWVQRVYGICCEAWARPVSPEFNRAISTFAVEPFINKHLYDLLLRAVGIRLPPSRDRLSKLLGSLPRLGAPQVTEWVSIPSSEGPEVDERNLVTADQRMCCVEIKGKISELWPKRLVLRRSDDLQIAEAAATGQPPVSLSAAALQTGRSIREPLLTRGSPIFMLGSAASTSPCRRSRWQMTANLPHQAQSQLSMT